LTHPPPCADEKPASSETLGGPAAGSVQLLCRNNRTRGWYADDHLLVPIGSMWSGAYSDPQVRVWISRSSLSLHRDSASSRLDPFTSTVSLPGRTPSNTRPRAIQPPPDAFESLMSTGVPAIVIGDNRYTSPLSCNRFRGPAGRLGRLFPCRFYCLIRHVASEFPCQSLGHIARLG